MSRANRPDAELGPRDVEARQLAAFFRSLAGRIEKEPALSATIRGALEESGLLTAASQLEVPPAGRAKGGRRAAATDEARGERPALDPFVVYREHGEGALGEALSKLDVTALRTIVRAHRLDPARISARWTTPDRLVALIVQQVRARANIGRAFAQV